MLNDRRCKILQKLYVEHQKAQDNADVICLTTEGARYSSSYMLNDRRCRILQKLYAERQKMQDTPEFIC